MNFRLQNSDRSDEELLGAMLEGDEPAFTALYRRKQGAVYRFALQMSGSPAAAEDVTQEVFLALLRDGRGFNPDRGTVTGYLYGIARNKVRRWLDREAPAGELCGEPASPASGPLEDVSRKQSVDAVRLAVLALPAHYREAVVLCDLHEMAYEQAAEALGCAVGTIRSRLHRGRELLAEKLRPQRSPSGVNSSISPARSWS